MKTRLLFIVVIITVLVSCHKNGIPPEVLPVVIPHPEKPNIILIIGDDIGYEIPTCNGGQSYKTPNLDNLSESGMRFTQCYSSPYCAPSRTMLLTGKYSFRNYYSWGKLNTDQKTVGNLLKDRGYETLYAGKWQLDGGAASIKQFGFDKYTVFLPFKTQEENEAGYRYKNPAIYTNGNFLSLAQVQNKYSEDIFSDSVASFIKQNINNPFFVYYSMNLCHLPFSPTPDNDNFLSWDPDNPTRPKYFPDMVSYMDKKVGEIMALVNKYGIDKETIILFIGDNGSPENIESVFQGRIIAGGKGTTTTYGTHVPLIAYWPGKIMPGRVSESLIDFTDFLPTMANISNTQMPMDYGILDGHSFYSSLTGINVTQRDFIFDHYFIDTLYNRKPSRWVQDTKYKLYNSGYFHAPGFYNLQSDILETNPIPDEQLTSAELLTRQNFQQVLDSLK